MGGLHGRLEYTVHLVWELFTLVDREAMIAAAMAERTTGDQSTLTVCQSLSSGGTSEQVRRKSELGAGSQAGAGNPPSQVP